MIFGIGSFSEALRAGDCTADDAHSSLHGDVPGLQGDVHGGSARGFGEGETNGVDDVEPKEAY